LLVATIAGTGLMIVDRIAVFSAAIAALAILAEQLYTGLTYSGDQTSFMPAGILGATLIATALLATVLARRNRDSEALATQRKADFDNLAELNEQIIQQMKSGILFVNPSGQILVANGSARQLLGIPNSIETPNLWTTSSPLASALTKWQKTPSREQSPIIDRKLDIELQPHFLPLGEMGTLIRVEDNSELKGQLQQLKLASLGRLTASIAHEIRNPLGAISHAAQLLEESDSIDENEMRLTRIVIEQSQRMNGIIEDVLQLSRRQKGEPQKIGLLEDLTKFAAHFCDREKLPTDAMHVTASSRVNVYMDPNHLHQILWNLCSNSMRHGGRDDIVIDLAADILGRSDSPHLEIRDNGVGIQAEKFEDIFEPFFTTSHEGTGLGLYIARELCELNDARLELRRSDSGVCFRIVFSPPPDSVR
jgi:two-component system sensor histidine kinase PilS (NtrC family)